MKVAKEMNCGRSQIYNLLKRKSEILTEYEDVHGLAGSMKRIGKKRRTGFEEINRLCWEFVQDCVKVCTAEPP